MAKPAHRRWHLPAAHLKEVLTILQDMRHHQQLGHHSEVERCEEALRKLGAPPGKHPGERIELCLQTTLMVGINRQAIEAATKEN